MVFHRWETISHIISDTKLKWFERAEFDEEAEMDIGDERKIGIIQFRYDNNFYLKPSNFIKLDPSQSF